MSRQIYPTTEPSSADELRWTAVHEFPQYKVSSTGQVFGSRGWLLTGEVIPAGYRVVFLYQNGKCYPRYVHALVAGAFIGARPDGMTINHKDGDKLNNAMSNLEYVSMSDNVQHAYDTGLALRLTGEQNGRAVLTAEQVGEIRKLAGIETQSAVAERFGISRTHVSSIQRGKVWTHLTPC